MIKQAIRITLFMLLLILTHCPDALATTGEQTFYEDVLIKNVPRVSQKPDFCGEACAEMYLRKLGRDIDQNDIFNQSGVDPLEARGCFTPDLARALKRIGFHIGNVWYTVAANNADQEMTREFEALHAELLRGIPSIICMHYDDQPNSSEHFRLVLGYDSKNDELIYHEPADVNGAYQRITRAKFFRLWPLKYDSQRWTVIRMSLKAGRIRNPRPAPGFTDADFAQHIMKLNKKIPNQSFTVVVQKPFVIIGDEPPGVVKRRAVQTVKWATDKLKQDYFKSDPIEIIDIWLFRDKRSYRKYTSEIFKDRPDTPFGYYSDKHNSLIMNIATGGGTLVHEMVHAFMSSNFPECPPWFNEGLASLYEQCREKNGRIYGLTNWRLAGLQKQIRAGNLPSFKTLTHAGSSGFYAYDDGDNYAQARYLCYYLQEKDLLVEFHRRFLANRRKDPSGFQTLKTVLGESDMCAFQERWEQFVLGLTFP